MKKEQTVSVVKTGETLVITRVDSHVYPICAGYRRFKTSDLKVLSFLKTPRAPNINTITLTEF